MLKVIYSGEWIIRMMYLYFYLCFIYVHYIVVFCLLLYLNHLFLWLFFPTTDCFYISVTVCLCHPKICLMCCLCGHYNRLIGKHGFLSTQPHLLFCLQFYCLLNKSWLLFLTDLDFLILNLLWLIWSRKNWRDTIAILSFSLQYSPWPDYFWEQ